MKFDELTIGKSAEFAKTITEADVMTFAGVTGDFNPVHIDPVAAATSRFGGRIAHGMLSAGLISAAIGNKLPGPGSIYLGQTLKFILPVRIGDTVTATIAVTEILPKRRVRLSTICTNQNGEKVLEGEATVMLDEANG
ncbi:MAG TPA: MaoC family dehydratase [Gemmatimonadaceae bacterium]|nr:MaoC family dehydratase [Gemmatimonadaceae bacterium]